MLLFIFMCFLFILQEQQETERCVLVSATDSTANDRDRIPGSLQKLSLRKLPSCGCRTTCSRNRNVSERSARRRPHRHFISYQLPVEEKKNKQHDSINASAVRTDQSASSQGKKGRMLQPGFTNDYWWRPDILLKLSCFFLLK